MKRTSGKTITVVAAALAVALVLPAMAFGGQGVAAGPAGTPQQLAVGTANAGADSQLQERIENALMRRAARFDEALRAMERRQERLMVLAGTVEQAGGDVEQVRAMLQECDRLQTQAREQERAAAQLFLGVPEAGDRRGAFLRARLQARNSVQTMNQARVQLREAAQLLKDIAEDLGEGDDDA